MPHRDQGRSPEVNASALSRCLSILVEPGDLPQDPFRSDCPWTPTALVAALLLWVWSEAGTLGERWRDARRIVGRIFAPLPLPNAYQPFIRLVRRHSGGLQGAVAARFRRRMREELGRRFFVEGFAAFAVDGTRCETPRTASNEEAFAAKKDNGRAKRKPKKPSTKADYLKSTTPQIWLTMLLHLGTGLPWAWRTGDSGSSERGHLRDMLGELPANSLLVGDAGFTGYDLWREIMSQGHDLLVRVGANVRLLTGLGLARGPRDRVWLWPDNAREGQGPIALRLVKVAAGRETVWLVTTVPDPKSLSAKSVSKLYRLRWGIEVYYRHFKQTFERRKLRSRSAANARLELDWALVGLWGVCLLTLLEDRRADPRKVSLAGTLRAVRGAMRDLSAKPGAGQDLFSKLRAARVDSYVRKRKESRNYPRKKRKGRIGDPQIAGANQQQVGRAKELAGAARGGRADA